MSERMSAIGRAVAAVHPVKQQQAVARISGRMEELCEHGRTPAENRDHQLDDGDPHIRQQACVNNLAGFLHAMSASSAPVYDSVICGGDAEGRTLCQRCEIANSVGWPTHRRLLSR